MSNLEERSAIQRNRITPKEARGILVANGYCLTTKTIREWCKDRKFEGAHKLQGRWHIPRQEIMQLIKHY